MQINNSQKFKKKNRLKKFLAITALTGFISFALVNANTYALSSNLNLNKNSQLKSDFSKIEKNLTIYKKNIKKRQ